MLALKANEIDNVATVFSIIKAGEVVQATDSKGDIIKLESLEDIPYGHKISLQIIKKGDSIIKYGEEIGKATKEIKKGEYVHIHNLDSARARGDLFKK